MIDRRYMTAIAPGVLALAVAVVPVQAQLPAPVRVPRAVLERYVGEYGQDDKIVSITLSGDTLFREVPGQRVILVPVTETQFKIAGVFSLEFVTDQAGGVTQIVSDGVFIEHRLPRTGMRPAPPLEPPVAAVAVPRSVLERYVGTYEYIPGQMRRTDLRVVVRLRGDSLIRAFGMGEQILTPISETRFTVDGTSLVTEFMVDEAGVTQVMGGGYQQLLSRRTSKD